MSKEKDNDDFEAANRALIARMERHYDRVKETFEAKENSLKETLSSAIKTEGNRQNLAKDFLKKYRGDEKPDPNFMNFVRKTGQGGYSNDYEYGEPTGLDDPFSRDDE